MPNNTYKTENLPTKALTGLERPSRKGLCFKGLRLSGKTVFEVLLTDFHGLVTDFHGLFTIFHAKRVPASVNDTAAAHRPIGLPLPRLAKRKAQSACVGGCSSWQLGK